MKSKVTLKEIVGTKIIYALLLTCYYWMWARTDWQDWYQTVQYGVVCFTVLFFAIQADRIHKYKKEKKDEFAQQVLYRCDAVCLKLFICIMVITAYTSGILAHTGGIDPSQIGWTIMISILVLAVIRTLLFSYMDSRGL